MRKYQKTSWVTGLALLLAAGVVAGGHAAPAQDMPAPDKPAAVVVLGTQNKLSGRLTFTTGKIPNFKLRSVKDGIEVLSVGNGAYQVDTLLGLREIAGIEFRTEGKTEIALIRFAADCCQVQEHRVGNAYKIDFIARKPKEAPAKPVMEAAAQPRADKPPAKTAGAKPEQAKAPAPATKDTSEFGDLRGDLIGRLAQLNAPLIIAPAPGAGPASAATAADRAAKAPPAAAKPSCPAAFKMDGWRGAEPFAEKLQAMRVATAQAAETPSALAALAEFYVGYGLGGEALAVTQEAKLDGVSGDDRHRLQRDADLARLLIGTPIATTSVLLESPADCDRVDVPLWRALSAAAAGDQEAVQRDADGAARALAALPEPLPNLFASRIADAVPDDPSVQQAMAGAVRNVAMGSAPEAAARFLLQARIAHAAKDEDDDLNFLQRATQDIGITGLKAKEELAERHLKDAGNEGKRSEELLTDAARVYRDTRFGRHAATALSELKLERGDYVGALRVANDSAPFSDTHQPDSHGAMLAARVLRQLLVDKNGSNLPPPEQRLVIYWHYSGYAMPGEKGDDIRMGAAALMLEQGLPEAALEVMRQVSPQSIATPQGAVLYADAEAQAGDADHALALLKGLPSDSSTMRVTAAVLTRQGKPADAARQLSGDKELSGRLERASLLYEANDWAGAADAYADVLHDTKLGGDARKDAMDRYALAVALSGKPAAEDLRAGNDPAARTLNAFSGADDSQQKEAVVPAARDSLRRASQIEAMLPPAETPVRGQGG